MSTTRHFLTSIGIVFATAFPASASYASHACEVNSGPRTAALVELYTSEGCSSCPPADSQLRALRGQLPAGAVVVPVGLHVTYWDGLGWRDPFAQTAFDARQRALLDQRQARVAYTPQFFVNGDELRDWRGTLGATIRRVNARPAAATISLKATPITTPGADLRLDVRTGLAEPHPGAALYVAITESGLTSQVARGENGGATLHHGETARLWLGPVAFAQGQATLQRDVALPPQWRREGLHVLAFVQDAGAHVLQAVDTAACETPMTHAGSPQ
jgi:hypothetical protein